VHFCPIIVEPEELLALRVQAQADQLLFLAIEDQIGVAQGQEVGGVSWNAVLP